ncbi:MAG: chorismate mutase, partial [Lachnospira sp.]|nr:chorismate mutase [Lachnospira sp.]
MRDLQEIRKEIDSIDSQIVELYESRMKLTSEVAEYKIETG